MGLAGGGAAGAGTGEDSLLLASSAFAIALATKAASVSEAGSMEAFRVGVAGLMGAELERLMEMGVAGSSAGAGTDSDLTSAGRSGSTEIGTGIRVGTGD